jgi:phospholipid transport system transporter-binding protein
MIDISNDRWSLRGPVTFETYPSLEAAAANHEPPFPGTLDWSDVTEVDSSALALLFAWQRAARMRGKTVGNVNLPANLLSLAKVYGVEELVEPL